MSTTPYELNAFQYTAFQRDAFQIPPAVVTWPAPETVKFGLRYGPTGIEYIGVWRNAATWLRRR